MSDVQIGIKAPQFTPSPLNLFMNIPIHSDLVTVSFEPPTSKEGQYVCLKAEVDLIVAFSACPQVSLFSLRFERIHSLDSTRKQDYKPMGLVNVADCDAQDILSINCGKPVDAHFEIF